MRRLLPLAACALLLGASCGADERPRRRPNVLLLTVESLRTDNVSFQDGSNATTPRLAELAEEGVVYEDAHSVTSWTLAAHASLFTGLYPRAHAAVAPTSALGGAYTTIAEILAGAGYQTAGVASGPYLRTAHDLHQGFELYDDSLSSAEHADAHGDRTNPGMLDRLTRFLEEQRDPDRPFFLFGYFWDPHYDYLPPPPWDERFTGPECEPVDLRGYESRDVLTAESPTGQIAYAIAQYEGEIGWTDETIGRLFDLLQRLELWDDTLIVVTSDHGEEFFEHGSKGHKNNLHAESVHVPLVVKYPAGTAAAVDPGGREPRLASLVDVLPTILDVTGARAAAPLHGRSLLDPRPDPGRTIFYELLSVWFRRGPDGTRTATQEQWFGARSGRYKLLEVHPGRERMLFDVVADPGETRDLLELAGPPPDAPDFAALLRGWGQEMDAVRDAYGAAGDADLSPEEQRRLEELGYL